VNVAAWLRQLGLEQYEQAFCDNAVDAEVLPKLTADDLKELGVMAVGHRRKLLDAIAGLSSESAEELASPPVSSATTDPGHRQAAVLFADLVGYTALSKAIDPEELSALLELFFGCADRVVQEHGGYIDKHIGDCVMAVFGAPVAHGNDAERAVQAAIEITGAMPELSRRSGREMRVHVGVASGHVVASETGSTGRHEYTVTGESVNLASRLTDVAGAGEILISEILYHELSDRFDFEAAGDLTLKGFDEPVRAWRVLGLSAVRPEGRPLVGRLAELQQLRAVLLACHEAARGQTIYVRGEAGIGKTRLVEAFQSHAREAGFRCHTALVLDFGAGTGRDAIRTLVRSLLGLDVFSDAEAVRRASAAALAQGLVDTRNAVFLNDLLDLPQATDLRAFYDAMDYAARDQGKRDTVMRLVEHASRTAPRVIVVEDLHWADDVTLGYVAELAITAATCPVLLIVTSRMEGDARRQAWRAQCPGIPLTTIDLGALREEDARLMARSYPGADNMLIERCLERAAGHPLFLDQLLRHAGESNAIAVPGSIQSLVQARLDRLALLDRAALQVASVLGQRFHRDALRHLLQRPDYVPDRLLAQLLIRPQADSLLFAHALIRDAVYEGLLRSRRRALHRSAAEWFASRDPVLRAQHLDRAEDPEAPQAYLMAAQAEVFALHYEHALSLAERGLALATAPDDRQQLGLLRGELLRELGRTRDAMGVFRQMLGETMEAVGRTQALIGIGSCVRLLGGFQEGMDALGEAEPLARSISADRELAQTSYYRGCLLFAAGKIDACLTEHEQAFACATRAGDSEWQARALSGLGDAYYGKGRMRLAIEHFVQCQSLCRRMGFGRVEVGSTHMIGTVRRYLFECREAVGDLRAAVDLAAKVGNLRTEMVARTILGELLVDAGDLTAAYDAFSGALMIADTISNRRYSAYILYELGRALWNDTGRRAEAQQVLADALALSRETGLSFVGPRILAALAMAGAPSPFDLLAEGEAIIRSGCLAHNALWFYRDAIETSLGMAAWDLAERYTDELQLYTRPEPLPWADFFIDRGRALVALGRGQTNGAVEREIQRLRNEAVRVGIHSPLPTPDAGRYTNQN
jgi:class 3 adenylate cyclase/tetratricopeptide (TPR) repeat protein